MQRSKPAERFEITTDGRGLTSRSGTAALVELADRLGLTAGLTRAATDDGGRRRRHRPGAVLRDLVVALADGGDCFSAIEVLRGQRVLLGEVASDSTAWRAVDALAGDELAGVGLDAARAVFRAAAWAAGGAPAAVGDPGSGPLCLNFDATLVTAHSDKQAAAGTYKGGYGFHPLVCYLDRGDGTGEALAGLLRPGNAGSATAADHIDVLESALAQLPALREDTQLLARADSAGCSYAFLGYLRQAGVGFSVGFRLNPQVKAAIRNLAQDAWTPAIRQDGAVREGAAVAELTSTIDLSGYPQGSRLLVRREPLHPGAQQTFDDDDGHRFTCFLTDQPEANLAEADRRHRVHARVEDRIRGAKDTGLRNLPSHDFAINTIWLQLVLAAQDLLAFFAALCLDGELARAEPATIRYRLLHVAGRITRTGRRLRLRIDHTWPWADALVAAFTRLRSLPAPAS